VFGFTQNVYVNLVLPSGFIVLNQGALDVDVKKRFYAWYKEKN